MRIEEEEDLNERRESLRSSTGRFQRNTEVMTGFPLNKSFLGGLKKIMGVRQFRKQGQTGERKEGVGAARL